MLIEYLFLFKIVLEMFLKSTTQPTLTFSFLKSKNYLFDSSMLFTVGYAMDKTEFSDLMREKFIEMVKIVKELEEARIDIKSEDYPCPYCRKKFYDMRELIDHALLSHVKDIAKSMGAKTYEQR